jgi:hypothetical protein
MAKGTNGRKVEAGNTVALNMHALGTLQYIRASIDAAGLLAVPGSAGITMGSVGCVAALVAAHPALARHWLAIWIAAAITAFLCGSAVMIQQAVSARSTFYRGPVRKFLLCLSPPLVAGALLTVALYQHHNESLIPGVWLLLYGSAVAAASTLTVRSVGVMGVLFMALGVLALPLSPAAANLVLGAGFGGLHLVFGVLIGWMNHEQR